MNNRTIRVILFIITGLFIAGVTWAIIAIVRRGNNETVETPTTQTNQPASTPPATNTPGFPAVGSVVAEPAPTSPAPQRQRIIVEEEVVFEISAEANAWASAGVNPDGSTYAEAHAE